MKNYRNKNTGNALISTIFIILLLLANMGLAWLLIGKEQTYQDVVTLSSQLKSENVLLREKLSNTQKEILGVKSSLEEEKKRLVKSNRLLDELQEKVKASKEELAKILGKYEEMAKDKSTLTSRVQNLDDERKSLQEKMGEFARLLESKDKELGKLKVSFKGLSKDRGTFSSGKAGPVELEPIVIEKAKGLKGRIIAVDKRHNFVVLDIGKDNGVKQSMAFDIFNKGKKIGQVRTFQLRSTVSACSIEEVLDKGKIRKGAVAISR